MRRHSGQSLQEYAIVLGLVVVVAIPVVMTMGGQVSNMLGSVPENESQFNQLVGLLEGPGSASVPESMIQLPLKNNPGLTASVNPATGEINLFPNGSLSSGANTTSVDGLTADVLEQVNEMLQSGTLPNGKPLSPKQKQKLQQMAQHLEAAAASGSFKGKQIALVGPPPAGTIPGPPAAGTGGPVPPPGAFQAQGPEMVGREEIRKPHPAPISGVTTGFEPSEGTVAPGTLEALTQVSPFLTIDPNTGIVNINNATHTNVNGTEVITSYAVPPAGLPLGQIQLPYAHPIGQTAQNTSHSTSGQTSPITAPASISYQFPSPITVPAPPSYQSPSPITVPASTSYQPSAPASIQGSGPVKPIPLPTASSAAVPTGTNPQTVTVSGMTVTSSSVIMPGTMTVTSQGVTLSGSPSSVSSSGSTTTPVSTNPPVAAKTPPAAVQKPRPVEVFGGRRI